MDMTKIIINLTDLTRDNKEIMRPFLSLFLAKTLVKYNKDCPTIGIRSEDTQLIIEYGDWVNSFSDNLKKEGIEVMLLLHELLHAFQGHLWIKNEWLLAQVPGSIPEDIPIALDWEVNTILFNKIYLSNYIGEEAIEELKKCACIPPFLAQQEVISENGWINVIGWLKWIVDHREEANRSVPDKVMGQKPGTGTMSETEYVLINPNGYKGLTEHYKSKTKQQESLISLLPKIIEQESYWIPSKISHLLPQSLRYPGIKAMPPKEKICIFIDTSGSMSTDVLQKVWPTISPIIRLSSVPYYAMVDTKIQKMGLIKGTSSFKELQGRGGTQFQEPLEELHKKYKFSKYYIYTDGCFDSFKIDKKISENYVWLIVPGGTSSFIKEIGGKIVWIK